MIEIFGWFAASLLVALTVAIHYEVMMAVSDRILPWAQRHLHGRRVMVVSMISMLFGHIIEIWLFAFAMKGLMLIHGFGALTGDFDSDLHAFLYFSAANYTAIGSEVHAHGPIREIMVSETLTGLMMITWSASFTYLKMEEIWRGHTKKKHSTDEKDHIKEL